MILNALRDANGAELQAIDVFIALHGIRSSDAAKRAAALEELRASQHTTSMHQMLASAASAATMNASRACGSAPEQAPAAGGKRDRAHRSMGSQNATNAKYITAMPAHEYPQLTQDVGFGVELTVLADIKKAHPFFGLRNVLKMREVPALKVKKYDFNEDRVIFDTEQAATFTQPDGRLASLASHGGGAMLSIPDACAIPTLPCSTLVGAFSLSASPFHSVGLHLASELAQFVKSPGGMMSTLGISPQAGTAILSTVHCIELAEDGEGKLRLASFDPCPTIPQHAEMAWRTSFRRYEWVALNRTNNAVTEAYVELHDTPDAQIRPVRVTGNRKTRPIAVFPALPYELPGLRDGGAQPTNGMFTMAILVPSGPLSTACMNRAVTLFNIISVEQKMHAGIVVRDDTDEYRDTMKQLSDRVDVVHVDIEALAGNAEELIVELQPFVAKGVALSNNPAVWKAMDEYDPGVVDDDEDGAPGDDCAGDDCSMKGVPTFSSPFESDDNNLTTIKAYFLGETPLNMEVAGPASAELESSLFKMPALLSIHTVGSTAMQLEKAIRNAAIVSFLKEGPSVFRTNVKTELPKVIFKGGRPGHFGALRFNQVDAAVIGNCSPGFVSGFLGNDKVDWGGNCESIALQLSYCISREAYSIRSDGWFVGLRSKQAPDGGGDACECDQENEERRRWPRCLWWRRHG